MPVKFRKQVVASESYESAGIASFFGNPTPEIVSGGWCYLGPDYREKKRIWEPPATGEYYDDFSTIPIDVTGNGYPDIVTGGFFGQTLRLLKNPGPGEEGYWECEDIEKVGYLETTRAWDLDGDGLIEIIPNVPGDRLFVYKLILDNNGKPSGKFEKHFVYDQKQGHGLGAADLTGNGQLDLLLHNGWLESPAEPWSAPWTFHPAWEFERASVPLLAYDFKANRKPIVIASEAHDYRFSWFGQEGSDHWIEHPIDPFNSQYHDMRLCDVDGDGVPEIVTGKRYYAHNGNDPGAEDDLGIYYFKWTGEGFAKQVIDYGPYGVGKGCGIYFDVGDLNGNGRPDLVAPGKDGLCIYWNEGSR